VSCFQCGDYGGDCGNLGGSPGERKPDRAGGNTGSDDSTDCYANADSVTDADTHANADTNTDTNANTDTSPYNLLLSDADTETEADADTNTEAGSNADADPADTDTGATDTDASATNTNASATDADADYGADATGDRHSGVMFLLSLHVYYSLDDCLYRQSSSFLWSRGGDNARGGRYAGGFA
jgi:hypothetical protein